MATKIFTGDAEAVAQINTETPDGAPDTGDTYTLKLTNPYGVSGTISFECGATETTAAVVTGLYDAGVAAAAGGEVPWNSVTCTDDTTVMTITADTAGDPFTVTASSVGGTLNDANTTACAGPRIYSLADNYAGGVAPVAADDVVIPAEFTGTIYGEDQSGTALDSFTDRSSATIGANDNPLQIDLADSKAATLAGSGTQYLALTGATATVNITNAGPGEGTGQYGTNLVTGEAAMAVYVTCGAGQTVGIAARAGKTGTFTPVKVQGGEVTIGSGVTIGAIEAPGGTVYNNADVTTLTGRGAEIYHDEVATVDTLLVTAGMAYYRSSGQAETVIISGSGVVNCDGDLRARTFTDTDIHAGGKLIDTNRTITHTNPVTLNQCGLDALDKGVDMNVAITAAS